MSKITDELNKLITLETTSNMTAEQQAYVSGLSDALDIVLQYSDEDYVIGKRYFVLMPDGKYHAKIEEMRLYRITNKKRLCYCFSTDLDSENPRPSLVLSSKSNLILRVYKSKEEAEKNIDCLWRRSR